MTQCTWTKDPCRNRCDDSSTLACKHKLDLCPQHIRRLIIQNAPAPVKCPTCDTPVSDADVIKRIRVDDKDDDAYARTCLQVIERGHPNYTQCPKCGNTQFHLGGNDPEIPIVNCSNPRCGEDYCFRDKILWKDGHNCKDFENKLRDGERRCPACNRIIVKTGGCLWMLCSGCSKPFCWDCQEPWNDSTHTHFVCPRPKGKASSF